MDFFQNRFEKYIKALLFTKIYFEINLKLAQFSVFVHLLEKSLNTITLKFWGQHAKFTAISEFSFFLENSYFQLLKVEIKSSYRYSKNVSVTEL